MLIQWHPQVEDMTNTRNEKMKKTTEVSEDEEDMSRIGD